MDKIFKVTYDDGSETLYTAEELGSAVANDPRFATGIFLWNGKEYVSCLKGGTHG